MRKQVLRLLLGAGLITGAMSAVAAGEADVVAAETDMVGDGIWRFSVAVKHADEGWNHYANRFEIVAPDGTVLGVRTLFHPHENEQPFTRSLGKVKISDDIETVTIRAHDSVHDFGGTELKVRLPR